MARKKLRKTPSPRFPADPARAQADRWLAEMRRQQAEHLTQWLLQQQAQSASDDDTLSERVEEYLVKRGGRIVQPGDRGPWPAGAIIGPRPLGVLVINDVTLDAKPGVWINWIEGWPGQRGAWALVLAALHAAKATFVAGETYDDDILEGWLRRGFFEIDEDEAAQIYDGIQSGDRFFMQYL